MTLIVGFLLRLILIYLVESEGMDFNEHNLLTEFIVLAIGENVKEQETDNYT